VSCPSFLIPFTCGHVYVRILSRGVELLERQRKYKEVVDLLEELLSQRLYGEHRRKKWWDRLTLVYDYHLKEKQKVRSDVAS